MATDYSAENPRAQLAKLQAEQPHVERLGEAVSMWQTAQERIRAAREELFMRTNELVQGSWRDDAGQAFGGRVEDSIMSMTAWDFKIDDSGVIGAIRNLQRDFPNCVAKVQAISDQLDAALQAQAAGGAPGADPALLEREFSKFAAQFTNHVADQFDAVTKAMGVVGDLPQWNGPRQEEPEWPAPPPGVPSWGPTGPPPDAGTAASPQQVQAWIEEARQVLIGQGVDASLMNPDQMAAIIQHESSGNPHAINLWDSNATAGHPSKGLMQTIDSTFSEHHLPGYDNIYAPVDNIIAGTRYSIDTYGSISNVPGVLNLDNGRGYVGY